MRVPDIAALRTRILAELHDSPTGAHCGRDRLIAELQKRFFWQGMATQAEQYVLTCDACQRNKHSKQLTPGLMMPLQLPDEPCMHWTTDAVTGLPKTKQGYDAIQVYVDRLTKLKRFALAHTSDGSVQLARNTLHSIIREHGMPKSMVSDRDPRITAKFWKELSRGLGNTVDLSTAMHAQSDGQSEREIQTVCTALRSYANAMGDDWDDYLPAMELALNSKQQASTGAAPFTLVYGRDARLPIDCALDGFEARAATVPAAGERAARMKKALDFARSKAELAQARQKLAADRHRRLLQLKPGDQVLLATEGLRLRSGMHKLTARYIGPFAVAGLVNDNAVTLDLPPLLGALHPTINISRLKVYRDGRTLFPTRPQRLEQPPAVDRDTNGDAQYEVESVLAQRGAARRRELLVRWKGYGAEHDQWQLRSELAHTASAAVAEFDARQADGTAERLAQLALAGPAASQLVKPKTTPRRAIKPGHSAKERAERGAAAKRPLEESQRCTSHCDGCVVQGTMMCADRGSRCACPRSFAEPLPSLCTHCTAGVLEAERRARLGRTAAAEARRASLRSTAAIAVGVN